MVQTVVAGDRDVCQLLVAVDDPAGVVAAQFGQHLAQRTVLEHQAALDPGQVLLRIQASALAEAIGPDADAVTRRQANALVAAGLQVDVAALHPNLGFAVEVAHGKIGIAHTGTQRAGLQFQRWLGAAGNLEVGLALQQPGHLAVVAQVAGKRRIGVEQDLGTVVQLYPLAFTHYGQMIGLQAHRQVAYGENPHQQHSGRSEGFPVWADT
ncbi:hypothetical protein D3C84_732970 [compost metagenome]